MDMGFGDCEYLDWVLAIEHTGDIEHRLGLWRGGEDGRNAQFNVDNETLAHDGIPCFKDVGATEMGDDFGVLGSFSGPGLCVSHESFEDLHIFFICSNSAEAIKTCHVIS